MIASELFLKALGLKQKGDCKGHYVENRKVMYPGDYGSYASSSRGCRAFKPKKGNGKKECGNCKQWNVNGLFE